MTTELFNRFLHLIETLTGMAPPESHRNHIKRELETLFRREKIDPDQFLENVSCNPQAAQQLINISTINETYFFREEKQFHLLEKEILPELFSRKQELIIWSVSCSTGEEAISLAVLTGKIAKRFPGRKFTVYASDINSQVLERFSKGIFSMRAFRNDGSSFHDLLLASGTQETKGPEHCFIPDPAILDRIVLRRLHIGAESPDFLTSPADLVFFRNTLLYMPMTSRSTIIERIARSMAQEGLLFLSASEVPYVTSPLLSQRESMGIYHFQRDVKKERKTPKRSTADDKTAEKRVLPLSSTPSEDEILDLLFQKKSKVAVAGVREMGRLSVITEKIEESLSLINASSFEEAERTIEELEKLHSRLSMLFILKGFVKKGKGEQENAIEYFTQAIKVNPDLWPARYHRANLLREQGKDGALEEYASCLRCLKELLRSNKGKAERLLLFCEGFDIAYFSGICEKWIEKIRTSEKVRV